MQLLLRQLGDGKNRRDCLQKRAGKDTTLDRKDINEARNKTGEVDLDVISNKRTKGHTPEAGSGDGIGKNSVC